MNNDYTHLTMILDRSGSMARVRDEIVSGFNQLVDEQKKFPGKCTVTLVQFDSQDPYEILRDMQDISQMSPLGDEYRPRACTPLYDAFGRGIIDTGTKLSAMNEQDRPAKVVFVVITDGLENASRKYTQASIAKMVEDQTDIYKWAFVFLGANQDAVLEGGKIGIAPGTSANYSEVKTSGAILTASRNLLNFRMGNKSDMDFTEEQKKELVSDK